MVAPHSVLAINALAAWSNQLSYQTAERGLGFCGLGDYSGFGKAWRAYGKLRCLAKSQDFPEVLTTA